MRGLPVLLWLSFYLGVSGSLWRAEDVNEKDVNSNLDLNKVVDDVVKAANLAGADGDFDVMLANGNQDNPIIVVKPAEGDAKGALAKESGLDGQKLNFNRVNDQGVKNAVISVSNHDNDGKDMRVDDMISSKKNRLMSEEFLFIVVLVFSTWGIENLAKRRQLYFLQMPNIAATLAITLGLVLSSLPSNLTNLMDYLDFNDDLFFMGILPIIIFESAFTLDLNKKKGSFLPIIYFAFLGTFITFVLTGLMMYLSWFWISFDNENIVVSLQSSLTFSALISATDPVSVLSLFKNLNTHPLLEALVTGESLINDAISISLYRSITRSQATTVAEAFLSFCFLFFFSVLVGIAMGAVSSLMVRKSKMNPKTELSLLLLFPYVSYLVAESAGCSGIVAILFCGMAMNRYCLPNISKNQQSSIKDVVGSLCLIAESIAFLLLGLAVFFVELSFRDVFIGGVTAIVAVSVSRLMSIRLTSMVYKYIHRAKISANIEFALATCGLRGAVALGLAKHAKHDYGKGIGSLILSSSLCYSLFTILIVGPLCPYILERLNVVGVPPDDNSLEVAVVQNSSFENVAMFLDNHMFKMLVVAKDRRRSTCYEKGSSFEKIENMGITEIEMLPESRSVE